MCDSPWGQIVFAHLIVSIAPVGNQSGRGLSRPLQVGPLHSSGLANPLLSIGFDQTTLPRSPGDRESTFQLQLHRNLCAFWAAMLPDLEGFRKGFGPPLLQ